MTLFRQLFLGSAILFLVLLLGVEAIYLANARVYLQQQLESHSQDAATSLSMWLGSRGSISDRTLVETVINPVFDRGYFQSIQVVTISGEVVARKELPVAQGGVPAWFVELFPLRAPSRESIISAGWNELGRVSVVSHPHFAYLQLWHTGIETLSWLAAAFILALLGLRVFLAGILRPLRAIEGAAVAIGERDFRTIAFVPAARELRSVVLAINSLSTKIQRVIDEESARAEQLRKQAYEDPVTGLYNRRGFEHQFANIVAAGRDVHSGVIILLQLDSLKQFNDRHGHVRADELLAQVARSVLEACRGHTVLAARLAGADFAVAAVNLNATEAEKLLSLVSSHAAACLAGEALSEEVVFHCGAVHFESGQPEISALLSSADLALARARGREAGAFNLIFAKEVSEPARGSQHWRRAIESALESNRFSLYAQPVMALPGRTLLHQEVMARLLDENGSVVPAAQFLPMAARHGLMPRLDLAMIRKLIARIGSDKESRARISLNIAAQTIADQDATRQLFDLLLANPQLASRLVFEMTEFGAVQDAAVTRAFASKLRSLGSGFALDNFGLHRAGLSALPALLPAYVKLAAEFTRRMVDDVGTRFLITSLSRIAQPLEITLIAQAVEQESILRGLEELGVGGYQGYISGKPAPFGVED
jgi:diguanylate cyclase (GGDEF)-like protein